MSKKEAEENKAKPTPEERDAEVHQQQLEKMLNPEIEFPEGTEVTLPDGTPGKVISVKGDAETGYIYSVQHATTTSFNAQQLKKA